MSQRVLTFIAALIAVFYSFDLSAWMKPWEPKLNCVRAELTVLPTDKVTAFLIQHCDDYQSSAKYSEGGEIDLNGDGIKDYAFFVPWMGNGLNASGYNAHFIVSDGKGGRVENIIEGYEPSLDDIVRVNGGIYYKHSAFFRKFERSDHNHWVYQFFSFGKDGVMRHANDEIGSRFPAVTIYYSKPRFKQIELTPNDRQKILDETKPLSKKYNPHKKYNDTLIWR